MIKLFKNITGTIIVSGLFFIPFLSYAQDINESHDNEDPNYIKSTIAYNTNQNIEKPVIRELKAHIRLGTVSSDIDVYNDLVNKGYNSAQPITSRSYDKEEDED